MIYYLIKIYLKYHNTVTYCTQRCVYRYSGTRQIAYVTRTIVHIYVSYIMWNKSCTRNTKVKRDNKSCLRTEYIYICTYVYILFLFFVAARFVKYLMSNGHKTFFARLVGHYDLGGARCALAGTLYIVLRSKEIIIAFRPNARLRIEKKNRKTVARISLRIMIFEIY